MRIAFKIRTRSDTVRCEDASRLVRYTVRARGLTNLETPDGFLNLLKVG
jgi:hypothetical protein